MRGLARGHGFLLVLAGVIALASALPALAAPGSPLGAKWVGQAAVAAIFLMLGLQIEGGRLAADLVDWHLHLLVQAATFLAIPFATLAIVRLAGGLLPESSVVGLLYLGMLPTTISTAIVFTMRAGGNMPAAVFNCALSNMLGVLLVPVWMAWHLAGMKAIAPPLLPVMMDVAALVFLPILVGQALRPLFGRWVAGRQPLLARAANTLILLLVFRAFANASEQNMWSSLPAPGLIMLALAVVGLLTLATGGVWLASGALGLSAPSRITALFCGSHKSLASGVALAQPVLASFPEVSVAGALLPVLLYHAAQLALGGCLIQRWTRAQGRHN